MYRWLLHLLLLIVVTATAVSESYYTIIAPGTIKSNRKYSVCITLHDVTASANIRVGIESENVLNISQQVLVKPFETKVLEFIPPKLSSSYTYQLIVEGISGILIQERKGLNVDDEGGPKIYIETDKVIFKPNDLLQFRVIILDEHTRPVKIKEPIKIEILDAAQNRVKQFKDIRLNKGVFTGEFKFSKEPILGLWTMSVTIGGKYALRKQHQFNVGKYILPKFGVHIETDPNFVLKDRIIKIEVYGKYTYGKYVDGKVDLEIIQPNQDATLFKQTIDIVDLKAKFEIDINSLKNLSTTSNEIVIIASLQEALTGIKQSQTQTISLQKQQFKIEVPESLIEFHNDEPYIIKAIVQHWNGTLVKDTHTPMVMQHGAKSYDSKVDENGMATFKYEFNSIADYEFIYLDSSITLPNIFVDLFKNSDTETSSCNISLTNKRPRFGSIIEVVVTFPSDTPYFVYTLTSHANIILHKYVALQSSSKSYRVQLTPTIEMVPTSYLYVHYILDGTLKYCEADISLPRQLENTISISSIPLAKPSQEVTLNITGQPNSRIFISAVDLSITLLNSTVGLNKSDIINELTLDKSYLKTPTYQYPGLLSGVLTLTNAYYRNTNFEIMSSHREPVVKMPIEMRSNFPEVLIFEDVLITNELTTLKYIVPDTITTWLISAFSINENTGLGIVDTFSQITVFKPFFVSINLPYSIKRGEIIAVPVTIFNYFPKNLPTEIVMENTEREYEFVDDQKNSLLKANETRSINVPANGGKNVEFRICPQKLGDIKIRVWARNPVTTDGIEQKLKVEPEGIVKQNKQDVYISLRDGQPFTTSIDAEIPSDIVSDSESLHLSMGGDALASTLENLDDLVLLPTGCGEQNMINLAPNILVLNYLNAVRKSSQYPDLVLKAKGYIDIGYQQQLSYRHTNGGYSVFGPEWSSETSNWLTAYVVRFFIKALKTTNIEERIIESGLVYLSDQQLTNGEFPHAGYVFEPAHQNRFGFTAFVLLTFLERTKYAKKYQHVIQKGLDFLVNNEKDVTDIYSLAIMATAFQMANSDHGSTILSNIQTMAKENNNRKWWTGSNGETSNDVEITSYILMALLDTPGNYLPIFEWLLEQRNKQGGFKSTHDTVVGLEALVKFSKKSSSSHDTNLKMDYTAKNSQGDIVQNGSFIVDTQNLLIQQQNELPPSTRSVSVQANGRGKLFLQFSYNYYKSLSAKQDDNYRLVPQFPTEALTKMEPINVTTNSFVIKPSAKMCSDTGILNLEICFKFQPSDGIKNQLKNMVIMEVNLPSGFKSNPDNINELRNTDLIDRTDDDKPNQIIMYFTSIKLNNNECISIEADRTTEVSNLKSSTIKMYDYYNNARQDEVQYTVQLNKLCYY